MTVASVVAITSLVFSGVTATGFDNEQLVQELDPLATKLAAITGYSKSEVLYQVFGELHFTFTLTEHAGYTCWSTLQCYGSKNPLVDPDARGLLVHELGHRFLNDLNLPFHEMVMSVGYEQDGRYVHVMGINPKTWQYQRTAMGYPHPGQPYEQHGHLSPDYNTYKEDFADTFMNWALGQCTNDTAGRLRCGWMDAFVKKHIKYATPKLAVAKYARRHPLVVLQ